MGKLLWFIAHTAMLPPLWYAEALLPLTEDISPRSNYTSGGDWRHMQPTRGGLWSLKSCMIFLPAERLLLMSLASESPDLASMHALRRQWQVGPGFLSTATEATLGEPTA